MKILMDEKPMDEKPMDEKHTPTATTLELKKRRKEEPPRRTPGNT
jgi:hypothetical protein